MQVISARSAGTVGDTRNVCAENLHNIHIHIHVCMLAVQCMHVRECSASTDGHAGYHA